MENQHRKIKGYRELNQEEIDLMNEIKEFGPKLEALIKKIGDVNENLRKSPDLDEAYACGQFTEEEQNLLNSLHESEHARWVSIGKTHLQQGLMALTRAVAKPTFF